VLKFKNSVNQSDKRTVNSAHGPLIGGCPVKIRALRESPVFKESASNLKLDLSDNTFSISVGYPYFLL
jgi:hypothetical protein